MALLAKDEGANFEKPDTGMHDAVLVFVADVGTHIKKTQWGDKAVHQVVFCWEIDQKLTTGEYAGKPFMQSKRYTFTLFEKGNLSKDLESWFSKKISERNKENWLRFGNTHRPKMHAEPHRKRRRKIHQHRRRSPGKQN